MSAIEHNLVAIVSAGRGFRCHQGMPLWATNGEPQEGTYRPRDQQGSEYPLCAGYLRARAKHEAQGKPDVQAPARRSCRRPTRAKGSKRDA